jgi:hypothetical protein
MRGGYGVLGVRGLSVRARAHRLAPVLVLGAGPVAGGAGLAAARRLREGGVVSVHQVEVAVAEP